MESESQIQAIIDLMIKDKKMRVALAKQSHRLCFGAYFGHYIQCAIAPFHKDMFQLSEDPRNKTIVIMGARDSAKSTIMNTSLAIWSVLGFQQKKFVVIVSRTQQKAKLHFMSVRKELEDNKLLRADLGPLRTEEAQWGSSIVLAKYDAQIIFASVEQSLRGMRYKQHRPDLIIADDVEDNDSVKTFDGRNETYRWLKEDALPSGDLAKVRLIVLGTLLHEDSVMMRLKKDILSRRLDGVYREYPLIDAQGNILWKAKYPDITAIEARRLRLGDDRAWSQEFMLRIISNHERVIHPEWIHYYKTLPARSGCRNTFGPNTDGYHGTFVGVDPAISEEDKAAYTAMVVVQVFGWDEQKHIYILPHPINEHLNFPAGLEKMRQVSDLHSYGIKPKMYIEDVGFQKGLIEMLEAEHYSVEGVRPQGDKRSRLALISHLIKNGTILFPETGAEELIRQIVNFGTEPFKDLADALSLLIPQLAKLGKRSRPLHVQGEAWGDESSSYNNVGFGDLRRKIF